MRFSLLTAACALLAAGCAPGGGDVTEFDDTPERIVVDIAAGNVTVTGNAAVDGVSVATEISGDATPSLELSDGVLTVADDCAADCSIDYTIRTEGDAGVVVTTGDGNVTVGSLAGDVTVDAAMGAVTLATVAGDIQVIVGDGDILGTRLESTTATFEADDGDIDVTFDEVVTTLIIATERGDLTVQLPDGDYAFDATPEDRTELRIEPTPGASNTVALTTGDGDIIVYRR